MSLFASVVAIVSPLLISDRKGFRCGGHSLKVDTLDVDIMHAWFFFERTGNITLFSTDSTEYYIFEEDFRILFQFILKINQLFLYLKGSIKRSLRTKQQNKVEHLTITLSNFSTHYSFRYDVALSHGPSC